MAAAERYELNQLARLDVYELTPLHLIVNRLDAAGVQDQV